MGCTDQGGKPICFLSGVVAVIRAVPSVRLASPRPALLGVGWGRSLFCFRVMSRPMRVPGCASPLNHDFPLGLFVKSLRW